MVSSTLKRSVATFGVVAGLLAAAAVPASAQIGVATTGTLHSGPGPVSINSEVEPVELRAAPQGDRGQGNAAGMQVFAWHRAWSRAISSLHLSTWASRSSSSP